MLRGGVEPLQEECERRPQGWRTGQLWREPAGRGLSYEE